ncbi:Os02g0517875 [Oryza sativa Japonica Group]|uniref:Uncharacterized protein n=2 Tax=Oryza sativa subsp. japonica TaxID=39947 RepID=A0A0N7KFD6_ORYSJ|nr:hypothetical protein [Oryza sativa Japonica Group]BAD38561.1 hypothetical protein [Oryza sativa Japonica Group]BAS78921.1 Os02g0517875 [Oryza sativa Japonica Group]
MAQPDEGTTRSGGATTLRWPARCGWRRGVAARPYGGRRGAAQQAEDGSARQPEANVRRRCGGAQGPRPRCGG